MAKEITVQEALAKATQQAKAILDRDRKPRRVQVKIEYKQRGKMRHKWIWETQAPANMYTWGSALSEALTAIYREYDVVQVLSIEEQLRREKERDQVDEVARFYAKTRYWGD